VCIFLQTRNVDLTQKLGELPVVLEPVLNKIASVPEIRNAEEPTLPFDQLTVSMHIVLLDGQILCKF
jgi:hypothetical protein